MVMILRSTLVALAILSSQSFGQTCGNGPGNCVCEGIDFQSRFVAIESLKLLREGGFANFDEKVLSDLDKIKEENIKLEKREKTKKVMPAIFLVLFN